MTISFLSLDFLVFSTVSIILVSVLGGAARQAVFLALNALFVWVLLGPIGSASTFFFCIIGYVLSKMHVEGPKIRLWHTLPLFVALFVYLRNYDLIQWAIPDTLVTSIFRTVGLSFLFFKIIHVVIDAKSKTLRKLDLLTYLNYCLNFMTFTMGPIQRYQDYYDQWNGETNAIEKTFEAHFDAVLRTLFGLVKAFVLAVAIGKFALQPDTDVVSLSLVDFAIQLWAFFFFLYLNFSGYCDIVIGIGSLMGVRPPENFDKPFLAPNISDFWLRQHRSLTLWLTDYVFSPTYKRALSGSALSSHPVLAGNLALMLTMLVSGLWHGTTIGFLIFGLVHGIYLMVYHSWDHFLVAYFGRKKVKSVRKKWWARSLGVAITFNAASFAFLFFQLDTPHLLQLIDVLTG